MSTEILWNVPSLIIWSPGTIKILTFNVGHAQKTNQSMTTTSSITSTMCSVMPLHIFVDQLVLHSKIFSGSPMPYSQKDIHSSKLLQIYLYSTRVCEFCVSMLSQHISLGLVCNMPWHKSLSSSKPITWSLSGISLLALLIPIDFLQYQSATQQSKLKHWHLINPSKTAGAYLLLHKHWTHLTWDNMKYTWG